MPEIQSAIDHIKSAIDVDPWAEQMAVDALRRYIPQKWVWDRPYHVACPLCGTIMDEAPARAIYKFCYNCGQRCEGVTDHG